MVKKPARITLRTVLQHVQHMELRLRDEFRQGLSGLERNMNGRFERVDERLDRIDRRLEWKDVGMRNMDERLDDIEVAQIPKLKKAVRMR